MSRQTIFIASPLEPVHVDRIRGLDPRRLKEAMRKPRIVDLRNIFNPEEMRGLGFAYEGIGRPRPRD